MFVFWQKSNHIISAFSGANLTQLYYDVTTWSHVRVHIRELILLVNEMADRDSLNLRYAI